MNRYFLVIEYDGTDFCGWQLQNNIKKKSIQECLMNAAYKLTGEKIIFHGAGRTDAGVHALKQVAHIDISDSIQEKYKSFLLGINFYLKDTAIAVLSMEKVEDTMHARFSALERSYRYIILNRQIPTVIDRNRVWLIRKHIDHYMINDVAKLFIGQHDFKNFRSEFCQAKSSIRTINNIDISVDGDKIIINISARSFLHSQVRMIVGAIMKVCLGYWNIDKIQSLLSLKCEKIAFTAPACGLYLTNIKY